MTPPGTADEDNLATLPEGAWHAAEAAATAKAFRTGEQGLDSGTATTRLAQFGPNRLPEGKRRSALIRLLSQFHNLLIYILLCSAAISLALGHSVDAVVIVAVVILNAIIGFIQEGRAEEALKAIRAMIDPRASVLRDGRRVTVAAETIVPGDLVLIEAGDRVPADLRLIRVRGLKIEEAVLTGESAGVDKGVEAVAAGAALGDRTSMAFSGTLVAAGQGLGIATGTGSRSELGRISSLVGSVESLETPLIRKMDGFARQLTFVILGISALTFLFAYKVRGYPVGEAFMTVVGLAVAAIPEGLPAMLTITLAIGVRRMATRNAIIRRLPAVETLGSVSVICSDKTGTLTRNEMSVRRLVTTGGTVDVSGVGYGPEGDLIEDGCPVDASQRPVLIDLIRAGLLCNDAMLRLVEGTWLVDGDPMEGALVTLAMKAGLDPDHVRREIPRTDEIPFDAAHRFMATLHHRHEEGESFVLIKGAPERLLDMCSREAWTGGARPIDTDAWRARADDLAAHGYRVLAFAVKPMPAATLQLTFAAVDGDATFLGLAGFIDPPREEAVVAIRDCHAAGIRVVMITGDHGVTAREIARQLGLAANPTALTGQHVDGLEAMALRETVKETAVFARTTPEHKLRLVEALQSDGQVVAMTGDGVNDAPALKRADVGVAMGQGGTEAAKQAAEMVLADDNFASIAAAVREGRTVYDNLVKTIGWTLPTNGGEALTIIAALAFGLALPITPAQILWVNMVTTVALGLTLAFEPTEPGTMRRPPRAPDEPILTVRLLWRIVFVSILFVAGAFSVFFWAEARGLPIETARTLVVNTLVVMEIAYLFSARYVHGTSLTIEGVLGTKAILIGVGAAVLAQFALTYLPPLQRAFSTRPLSLTDGLVVVGVGVVLLAIVEIGKYCLRAFTRS